MTQKQFLEEVRTKTRYWSRESLEATLQERCEGLAISILTLMDQTEGLDDIAGNLHESFVEEKT